MMSEQIYNDAIENGSVALRNFNGGSRALNRRLATVVIVAAFETVLRNADTIEDGQYLAIPTTELASFLARDDALTGAGHW